jgi:hypothetical protein
MTDKRKGDWLQTYSELSFWTMDPKPTNKIKNGIQKWPNQQTLNRQLVIFL